MSLLQCVCVGRVCVWLGEGVEGEGVEGRGAAKVTVSCSSVLGIYHKYSEKNLDRQV